MSRTPTRIGHVPLNPSPREASTAINYLLGATDFASLTNATNDTAAATAGVNIGQLYRNGSVVMVRVS